MKTNSFCRSPFARNRIIALIMAIVFLAGWVYPAGAAPPAQTPEEGQAVFQQKCAACHTIGGGALVGPDLQGVTTQRDRDWLISWITVPDQMLSDGDSIATQLLAEYNNLPMPNLAVTTAEAEALLAYLENSGEGGAAEPAAPALNGNPTRGQALFLGRIALENGGPACISCHSAGQVGTLGGGTLGPNLTQVYERFGEAGLAASLKGLPFPSMQGIFAERPLTEDEVADLHAFFIQTNQTTAPQVMGSGFVLIGLIGSIILVALGHFIWRKRQTGVRKPLVGR